MPRPKPDSQQARIWRYALVASGLLTVWLLRPYLFIIAVSIILAIIISPLYNRLLRISWINATAGVAISVIVAMLAIGLPLGLLVLIAVNQSDVLIEQLTSNNIEFSGENLESIAMSVTTEANEIINRVVGVREAFNVDTVADFLRNTVPSVLNAISRSLLSLFSGIPTFFANLIIFLFVFSGVLYNRDTIIKRIRQISPFSRKHTDLYLHRIVVMARGMMLGQLLIAFIQGMAGALSLFSLGWHEYFFLLTFIFTLLNFIPLGSGMITIPIGIGALVFGNVPAGLVILAVHFLVVTNIDNILRPRVVPKDAHLPAALTILSAFAGVYYFGFLGVIFGPIIMIIIMTTLDTYSEVVGGSKTARTT